MILLLEMRELIVCHVQAAQKFINNYQHLKQHADSMKDYTRFHALQQQAKAQLAYWQSELQELENKMDMKKSDTIHVGALVKPVTSTAKGIVLSIHAKRGKQYAKIRTIGYYPRVCNYLLYDLIILQPDIQDLFHIQQAGLTYIPAY